MTGLEAGWVAAAAAAAAATVWGAFQASVKFIGPWFAAIIEKNMQSKAQLDIMAKQLDFVQLELLLLRKDSLDALNEIICPLEDGRTPSEILDDHMATAVKMSVELDAEVERFRAHREKVVSKGEDGK